MWAAEPSFTDSDLRSIAAPTLLVVADRDHRHTRARLEMFRAIPNAQLCVVPNAGHGALPAETILHFLG